MTVTLTDKYSWAIAHCSTPADVTAALALPGSWPMGAQPTVYVRNDQWANLVPVGPSSPLDPSYAWDHAYWAEDPGWTNPGNGGNVTSWHDAGTQNIPLTGSSPYPTYTAADANLGNKPSLTSSSVNVYMNAVGSTVIAQPGTVVGVFYNSGTGTEGLFDSGSAGRWFWRFSDGSGKQQLYAGAGPVSYGTALGVGAYFAAITINAASSGSAINGGAFVPAGATIGTNGYGDARVPGTSGFGMAGSIAFVAFKGNGGLTPTQVGYLQSWAHTHYGFF
jgi:hypothetical protein